MKFELFRYAASLTEDVKLRTVYRGTGIPEKHIGDTSRMVGIFATTKLDYAKIYGDNIAAYSVAPEAKILDYDLSDTTAEAYKIVRRFLVDGGRITASRFDADPRNALAMQFMIPTEDFIKQIKSLGFDAVWMHADSTDSDEVLVINTSKFTKLERTGDHI